MTDPGLPDHPHRSGFRVTATQFTVLGLGTVILLVVAILLEVALWQRFQQSETRRQLLIWLGGVSVLSAILVGVMTFAIYRLVQAYQRSEAALQLRQREFELLNRAGQAVVSTLDLDQVLSAILEEVRHLLDVVACSVWLLDPETNELVCRQSSGPKSETVRGWRLAPGEGIVGWVVQNGRSLVIPDAAADRRHYRQLDQTLELTTRSLLTAPLLVQDRVIGALQVLDTQVGRFSGADLRLVEPLAATAAIAIENARLYEQARRDAETKSMLLNEVNHRVKNNLSAIIGLLYTEQRHAGLRDQATYRSIMKDLINRVRGLATVHNLLSAAEWSPLLLSDLVTRIVHSSLQALGSQVHIAVDVAASPALVTPNQANSLALIINELVTNAVKHAWTDAPPDSPAPQLTANIALEEDTILFEFRDNGRGYPPQILQADQAFHSVGFDLIQSLVQIGLRGDLALSNEGGAVTLIRFKVQVPTSERNSL